MCSCSLPALVDTGYADTEHKSVPKGTRMLGTLYLHIALVLLSAIIPQSSAKVDAVLAQAELCANTIAPGHSNHIAIQ